MINFNPKLTDFTYIMLKVPRGVGGRFGTVGARSPDASSGYI